MHPQDLSCNVLQCIVMTYPLAALLFVMILIPIVKVVKHVMTDAHYQRQLQHHIVTIIMMHPYHYNGGCVPCILVALPHHPMIRIEAHEGVLQIM
jgi:hypothetical protein